MRAATRLVIPIDNPSESLIFTLCVWPTITIAARRSQSTAHPPNAAKTPNAESPNALVAEVGFGTDHRGGRPSIASSQAFWLSPHISKMGRRVFHGQLATGLRDVTGARSRRRRPLRRKPRPSHSRRQPDQRDQRRRQQPDPGCDGVAVQQRCPRRVPTVSWPDVAGNVWASGAATAAFDAFDDHVPVQTVDDAHSVIADPIVDHPDQALQSGLDALGRLPDVPGVVGATMRRCSSTSPSSTICRSPTCSGHGDFGTPSSRSPTWIPTRRDSTSSSRCHRQPPRLRGRKRPRSFRMFRLVSARP